MSDGPLTFGNDGQDIIATNYWQSQAAGRGFFYLSVNAGAFRLLIPESHEREIFEMTLAHEVIISRGPWPQGDRSDGIEILFEDGSDEPFVIHLSTHQCDRLPGNIDTGKRWTFAAWTRDGKKLERPCWVRMVDSIPWMKPYSHKDIR